MKLEKFSLEAYKADPSRKVVTRDGRPVRILATDLENNDFPIAGAFKSVSGTSEITFAFTKEGKFYNDPLKTSDQDLMFLVEPKEYWINVFQDSDFGAFPGVNVFYSQKSAEEKGSLSPNYLTTIKIWEE